MRKYEEISIQLIPLTSVDVIATSGPFDGKDQPIDYSSARG